MASISSAFDDTIAISILTAKTMGRTIGLMPAEETPSIRIQGGLQDFYVLMWFSLLLFLINWGTRLLIVEPFARAVLKPVKKTIQEAVKMDENNLAVAREKVPPLV